MTYLLIGFVILMIVLVVRSDMRQKEREREFDNRMRIARAEADRRAFEQSLARTRNTPRPSVLRSVPAPAAPSRSDDSTPAPQPDNSTTNTVIAAALLSSTFDSSPSQSSSPSYDSSSDCGSSSSYDSSSSSSDCGSSSSGSDF